METIKNRTAVLSRVLRIVYIGVLLVHLLLWALNVEGQPVGGDSGGSNPLGCTSPVIAGGLFNSQSGKAIEADELRRRYVRDIYTSQIGVREKQANAGPEVERYLRYVNLPKGNPWCAAFVCWSLGKAELDNPRSGWSPDLFDRKRVIWASSALPVSGIKYQESRFVEGKEIRYRPTQTSDLRPQTSCCTPQTADVFGLFFPEKGRIAHVGFVDDWQDPWLITVEGNTNVLGSREGDGVYRKRRLVRSVYKVARYVN
jgi:hypothetical protein